MLNVFTQGLTVSPTWHGDVERVEVVVVGLVPGLKVPSSDLTDTVASCIRYDR